MIEAGVWCTDAWIDLWMCEFLPFNVFTDSYSGHKEVAFRCTACVNEI